MRRLTFSLFLIVLMALMTFSGCGTVDSITLGRLSNGTVTDAQSVLSTPTTVDFARLVGLRTLSGLQSAPPGTYTVAQIVVANPVISVLNLGPPATVSTQTLPFLAGGSTSL